MNENELEKILFSRELPNVPQHLKEKTMDKILFLKKEEEIKEATNKKIINTLVSFFTILLIMGTIIIIEYSPEIKQMFVYIKNMSATYFNKNIIQILFYISSISSIILATIFHLKSNKKITGRR